MYILRFLIVLLYIFTFNTITAFTANFDIDIGIDRKDKQIFYNEKEDINIEGLSRKDKNYAKIGAEDYSQKQLWRKFYFGIDINWHAQRFDDKYSKKYTLYSSNFWDRLKNLDVYFGMRAFKYFGVDFGYSYFGNLTSKKYDGLLYREKFGNYEMHGIFIDSIFYTPAIHINNYTSVELYILVGGVVFFSGLNDNKGIFGAKFGTGLMIQVYGPLAINIGVDYYYPLRQFSNNGMLMIKTGLNFFVNL